MSKEISTPKETSMADLKEQLAAQVAAQAASNEATGGNSIQASHTGFKIPEIGDVASPLNVVILNYASLKTYYDKPYNQNEFRYPACGAIGAGNFDSLVPSDDAPNPISTACNGCEFNEYGSATNGRGKKCTEYKYIAFMLPDAEKDDPIYTARVSPAALKPFGQYISRLTKRYGSSTVEFISELSIIPAGSSVAISVKEVEAIEDPVRLAMYMSRQSEAIDMLLQPIQFAAVDSD